MAEISHQVVVPLRPRQLRIFLGHQLEAAAITWKLTPRETLILDRILCAYSDSTIARQLGLSPRTVHRHVRSLLFKSATASRAELVSRALHLNGCHEQLY